MRKWCLIRWSGMRWRMIRNMWKNKVGLIGLECWRQKLVDGLESWRNLDESFSSRWNLTENISFHLRHLKKSKFSNSVSLKICGFLIFPFTKTELLVFGMTQKIHYWKTEISDFQTYWLNYPNIIIFFQMQNSKPFSKNSKDSKPSIIIDSKRDEIHISPQRT